MSIMFANKPHFIASVTEIVKRKIVKLQEYVYNKFLSCFIFFYFV